MADSNSTAPGEEKPPVPNPDLKSPNRLVDTWKLSGTSESGPRPSALDRRRGVLALRVNNVS